LLLDGQFTGCASAQHSSFLDSPDLNISGLRMFFDFVHPFFLVFGLLLVVVLFYDILDLLRLLDLIHQQPSHDSLMVETDAGSLTRPSVDIVIPIYNMGRSFERTLRSIEASSYPKRRIIVVDDGSDDGETFAILNSLRERIDILDRIEHGGKSAAANRGARLGEGELIFFLDADSYVVPDFIEQTLAECSDEVGAIDFVQQVANPGASFWTRVAAFERELLTLTPDNFGALFAIRRRDFEQGPFQDCLSPQFEINDRLKNLGRLKISPRKVVFSDEPVTLLRTYRRKRRWAYGWLEACQMHQRSFDFHFWLPAIDVLLMSLMLFIVWRPELALFPLGLLSVWMGKSLLLARRLKLEIGMTATVLYPVFMVVLCMASVEAAIRFFLKRRVAWV
jgi:cellulose synthase/poly-beta-1,6-N-acetylglucosamine synthase-like glycosyltransferase